MRLLYLTADPGVPVLGHKGASVHVRELVRAFAASGALVTVVSPRIDPAGESFGAAVDLVPIEPVLPRDYPSASALRLAIDRQAVQIHEIAKSIDAEAVYERFSLFSDGGVRVGHELGVPHVLEVNAPLREEARRYRALPHPELAAAVERDVFAATGRILAVSETLAGLLERAGVARDRIDVVPNAVDPAKFPRPSARDSELFTIGFAGSLKPWHGVEVLLEAFEKAARELPHLRLEIVGEGPARDSVARARLSAGTLIDRGPLSHAKTIEALGSWQVGAAPFLDSPSFYFSPLKLLEYMAAGVCPVASDQPEIRTLLGDGERGVLVPAGDSGALAAAIVLLARDPRRVTALGMRAREHVLGSHTWSRNADHALGALRPRGVEVVA